VLFLSAVKEGEAGTHLPEKEAKRERTWKLDEE
jgi:hypothetical protein